MKTCFKCNVAKPLAEFYKHSAMADGYINKCKQCTKKDVSNNRAENIEKIREYDRERSKSPVRIKKQTEVIKSYKKLYPKRILANNAVNNAIRDGKLIALPCFICGTKAMAHHPDYDRPLDVVWLCQVHHKQAHAIK